MDCRRVVVLYLYFDLVFCFFKQKTAYEMRISDWSSDVCSSDLGAVLWPIGHGQDDPIGGPLAGADRRRRARLERQRRVQPGGRLLRQGEIGRASCRERVCQYV